MKYEEEKNDYLPKIFDLYFSETLNFADFKYVFRFFISSFDQKLHPSKGKNGQKQAKLTHFEGL